MAFALVHELAQRLAAGCVPAFLTDGLVSYFHALTAHFGHWSKPPRARKRHWQVSGALLHGLLIKRKHRRNQPYTHTRMALGKRSVLYGILRQVGLRPRIQTAFIERVNLTFRQIIAPLTRRTWAYAQSDDALLLHCAWFRLYYHLVRPHQTLRLAVPGLKRRYRARTPAMALGLTDRLWSVRDLLHSPLPQAF